MAISDVNNRLVAISDEAIAEGNQLLATISRLEGLTNQLSVFEDSSSVQQALLSAQNQMQEAISLLNQGKNVVNNIIAIHNN